MVCRIRRIFRNIQREGGHRTLYLSALSQAGDDGQTSSGLLLNRLRGADWVLIIAS